jgi:ribosomal protein S18 acetylase RimI-like enzyme
LPWAAGSAAIITCFIRTFTYLQPSSTAGPSHVPAVLELLRLGHRISAVEQRGPSGTKFRLRRTAESPSRAVSLVVSDLDDGLSERIDAELVAFNSEVTGHQDLQFLRVAVWDSGDLLAGLCGATWGGCGFIDLIWVRADCRRRGLGTRLLDAGEKEIRRRGCDQVGLSTYSFQAAAFYVRAGYIECGRRFAFPHGHDQILFVKRLS